MKDLTYHEGDIMNKQKKELYSFLKKFGWEEDQIAFIDSLPLTDERKKYIFKKYIAIVYEKILQKLHISNLPVK